MTTPLMAALTPKMAGVTPNSQQIASSTFGFSPALLGQSPAAFLNAKHRSPMPGSFGSPNTLAGLAVPGSMGTPGTLAHLPPDEKKKRELQEMMKLLASRPGRISEAAVETLAARMGWVLLLLFVGLAAAGLNRFCGGYNATKTPRMEQLCRLLHLRLFLT